MDAKDFVGNKVEERANILFGHTKEDIRDKLIECIILMGEYVDHRATTDRICRDLAEILKHHQVKDVPQSPVQKHFYTAAWNDIQSQHTH